MNDDGLPCAVNGTLTRVYGVGQRSGMELIGSALRQTGTRFRDSLDWELRDESGRRYDWFKTADVPSGVSMLYVNLLPGVGA